MARRAKVCHRGDSDKDLRRAFDEHHIRLKIRHRRTGRVGNIDVAVIGDVPDKRTGRDLIGGRLGAPSDKELSPAANDVEQASVVAATRLDERILAALPSFRCTLIVDVPVSVVAQIWVIVALTGTRKNFGRSSVSSRPPSRSMLKLTERILTGV
jgi:hypothetical protein